MRYSFVVQNPAASCVSGTLPNVNEAVNFIRLSKTVGLFLVSWSQSQNPPIYDFDKDSAFRSYLQNGSGLEIQPWEIRLGLLIDSVDGFDRG